jgi:ribosome biogenesis protein UTP30
LNHLETSELTENFAASLPKIVAKHVKGGWENVQSIDIKTGTSAALPVWNSKLDDRWIGMPEPSQVDKADKSEESLDDEEENVEEVPSSKKTPTTKKVVDGDKKIRSSISKENVASKSSKKAKKAA